MINSHPQQFYGNGQQIVEILCLAVDGRTNRSCYWWFKQVKKGESSCNPRKSIATKMYFNSPDEPQLQCDMSNVFGPQQVQDAEGLCLLGCCLFSLWGDRN